MKKQYTSPVTLGGGINTGNKKKEKYEREMERKEDQDREETNEGILRIVHDPYKKVQINRFEINEERRWRKY